MALKQEIMARLSKTFQKHLFHNVVKKYNGSLNAGKILKIPASSVRGYKNLYFNSVPQILLKKLINLKLTDRKEIKSNTISVFDKSKQIESALKLGREKRKSNILILKRNIPNLNEIIWDNKINVLRWFNQYVNLLNIGFRRASFSIKKDYIVVKYLNFNKQSYKKFQVKLPREFILDSEFSYFLGLWCGDRVGGKRFGICNKNKEIINFTKHFLKRYNQRIEKILIISKGVPKPKIDYDKKFVISNDKKGWVLSVHSNNGILYSFFHYLYSDLAYLLNVLNKNAFFAGLFDAEGNVSMYNKSFRWACKNPYALEIYSNTLNSMKLYKRYDGNCIICDNLMGFYNKVYPYLKHNDKIAKTNFLCTGKGKPPQVHTLILRYLGNNPQSTAKEISKALKKTKLYSELGLLFNFGFIKRNGYPYRYEINREVNDN